jgi:hypothetical protein
MTRMGDIEECEEHAEAARIEECDDAEVTSEAMTTRKSCRFFQDLEGKRMSNFLSNNYVVVVDMPSLNKSLLKRMILVWRVSFKSVC